MDRKHNTPSKSSRHSKACRAFIGFMSAGGFSLFTGHRAHKLGRKRNRERN